MSWALQHPDSRTDQCWRDGYSPNANRSAVDGLPWKSADTRADLEAAHHTAQPSRDMQGTEVGWKIMTQTEEESFNRLICIYRRSSGSGAKSLHRLEYTEAVRETILVRRRSQDSTARTVARIVQDTFLSSSEYLQVPAQIIRRL